MKSKLLIGLLLATATALAQHPLDTIRVQCLVVDTSSNLLAPFPRPARLLSLLAVRELHNTSEGSIDPGICPSCWNYYWKHIRYLTVLRAPVPFGWVVFEGTTLQDADAVAKFEPHNWPLIPIDSIHDRLANNALYLPDRRRPSALGLPQFQRHLPRRLRKRYLKYVKSQHHAQ